MSNIYYFAYGSNMHTERMKKRIPSAQLITVAILRDYELVWDKISKDGSGKANLSPKADGLVWGIVYRLPEHEIDKLNRIEGGYDAHTIEVETQDGEKISVFTYISEKRDSSLRPTPDYKAIVIRGAREHKLPESYIAQLEKQPTLEEK